MCFFRIVFFGSLFRTGTWHCCPLEVDVQCKFLQRVKHCWEWLYKELLNRLVIFKKKNIKLFWRYLKVRMVRQPGNLTWNIMKEIELHLRPGGGRDQLGQVLLPFFEILLQPMPQDVECALTIKVCHDAVQNTNECPIFCFCFTHTGVSKLTKAKDKRSRNKNSGNITLNCALNCLKSSLSHSPFKLKNFSWMVSVACWTTSAKESLFCTASLNWMISSHSVTDMAFAAICCWAQCITDGISYWHIMASHHNRESEQRVNKMPKKKVFLEIRSYLVSNKQHPEQISNSRCPQRASVETLQHVQQRLLLLFAHPQLHLFVWLLTIEWKRST